MYTGFKFSLSNDTEFIFCTDSDTIVDMNAVIYMNKYMNGNPHTVGIVGNLEIFNKYDSIVSFLSSLRYWFAFNVERAYQSFNKYVLCISGPIGFYRLNILKLVIDDWYKQSFLGNPCTYGDDRHLTNKILAYGHVHYLSMACASTETPSDITRFFKQQTRWHKSANRETFWTLPLIHKHSYFMTVDLIYNTFYPFIVMGYMIYLLWFKGVYHLGIFFILAISLTFIKSAYAFWFTKNLEMFFYPLYNIIYITLIFPSKINSILSFADISWGTAYRHGNIRSHIGFDIILLVLWNFMLISGLIYNICTTFTLQLHNLTLGVPLFLYLGGFIVLFSYIKQRK
jgi:hyaluronan synthase